MVFQQCFLEEPIRSKSRCVPMLIKFDPFKCFLIQTYIRLYLTTNFILTSLPKGIPLPSVAVSPTTLAINVRKVRYSFNVTPLKIVFISGMPEPILDYKLYSYTTLN